ncbi:hypothetical protein PLUA15_160179 [Pseudomonas lundensis]|uniref:Uncharacterized protein n=1 Tax=Pseudomonas lundensis TaxID=86185 RepID=A0AAX2H5N4_9PSED|nr:hypothetical protein PLUA15_160179 [Pseudomonas lundensis]
MSQDNPKRAYKSFLKDKRIDLYKDNY